MASKKYSQPYMYWVWHVWNYQICSHVNLDYVFVYPNYHYLLGVVVVIARINNPGFPLLIFVMPRVTLYPHLEWFLWWTWVLVIPGSDKVSEETPHTKNLTITGVIHWSGPIWGRRMNSDWFRWVIYLVKIIQDNRISHIILFP